MICPRQTHEPASPGASGWGRSVDLGMLPYIAGVYAGGRLGDIHGINLVFYVLLLANGLIISTGFHILVLALGILPQKWIMPS